MDKVFFRTGFNYDRDAVSRETALNCEIDPVTGEIVPSMTSQQFADDVDINTIVRRFGLTGQLPQSLSVPLSGDFTGVTDFHSAMNLVVAAQDEFMKLPADVRDRFGNDPGALVAFVSDEANRDEAVKLGIVPPPPERTRDVVQAVDELAAKLSPPKS